MTEEEFELEYIMSEMYADMVAGQPVSADTIAEQQSIEEQVESWGDKDLTLADLGIPENDDNWEPADASELLREEDGDNDPAH